MSCSLSLNGAASRSTNPDKNTGLHVFFIICNSAIKNVIKQKKKEERNNIWVNAASLSLQNKLSGKTGMGVKLR